MAYKRQRVFQRIANLSLLLALQGCASSSDSNGTSSGSNQQSVNAERWQIKIRSKCSGRSTENCLSGYGFTVFDAGEFQAGPTDKNSILKGQIAPDELRALHESLSIFEKNKASPSKKRICVKSTFSDSEDVVSLEIGETTSILIESFEKEYCYDSVFDLKNSQTLLNELKTLALHYYPVPFPQENCEIALTHLNTIYQEALICNQAQDCTYINPQLKLIPSGTLSFLTYNECSPTKPFIVGNSNYITNRRSEILNQIRITNEACSHTHVPADCSGFSAFQPTIYPPTCDEGVCKVASNYK